MELKRLNHSERSRAHSQFHQDFFRNWWVQDILYEGFPKNMLNKVYRLKQIRNGCLGDKGWN